MQTGSHMSGGLAVILVAAGVWFGCGGERHSEGEQHSDDRLHKTSDRALDREETHRTEIRAARRLGYFDQHVQTPAGAHTVGVRCSTCHDSMVGGPLRRHPDELGRFHSDMNFDHGELSCSSCHAPEDRDRLRLADGTRISFERTMELCGQCHGPQLRDYRHGAHGGMSGHWDLSRGKRVRNHCVNCHDPHEPSYPTVEPAPPPRDRFLNASPESNSSSHTPGEAHE